MDGLVYTIETFDNEYYMIQLNHNVMQECCENYSTNLLNNMKENTCGEYHKNEMIPNDMMLQNDRFHDGTGDIKVLVLYTPSAANSVSNIYNTALLAEEESNISFQNSDINCQIEIVYIGETDYIETTSASALSKLCLMNDGDMDEVHGLRDVYSADVCVLLENCSDYCGMASNVYADQWSAFAVVKAESCATGYFSFIHEIGHLIGCRHDYSTDTTSVPYVDGHGYVSSDGTWRTIMSYGGSGCTRLPYWSNPNILYNGEPMGSYALCNNARVWNDRYGTIGTFRMIKDTISISQNEIDISFDYGYVEAGSLIETFGNAFLRENQELVLKSGDEIVLKTVFMLNMDRL